MEKTYNDRVAAMRAQGMGYSVIASALGLTKSQVSGYCRRAGIEKWEGRKPAASAATRAGSRGGTRISSA